MPHDAPSRTPFLAAASPMLVRHIDLSIFKDFNIKERYLLQFRGEAFNLFNTPFFQVPGNNVASSSFGVVSAQLTNPGPRELQFSLRLSF